MKRRAQWVALSVGLLAVTILAGAWGRSFIPVAGAVTLTGTCDPSGLIVTLSWQSGGSTNGLQRGSNPLTPGSTCSGTADYWCFLPNNPSEFTYTDTDLSPNVRYEYRVKVTATSFTNSFFCDTTPVSATQPPEATTYAATGLTQTSATLNGGVNPNGRVTTYWFEWSTGGGQAQTVGTASLGAGTDIVPVFFPLGGLQSNTLYSYRVVAQSSQGTTRGGLVNFMTTGGGSSPPPPPPPTGGAPFVTTNPATDITATSATLNGSVNPNGRDTKVWFDYGRTDSLGKSSASTAIGSGRSPTDVTVDFSNADPDTLYYYRVVASNPSGWSYGSILSFRTARQGGGGTGGGGGGAAPTTRTTVATNVSKTAATLNGVVNPSGATTRAWFEYGTTKQLGQVSETALLGSGTLPVGVSVAVFELQADTTYYYRLVARNAFGTTRGAILSTVSVGSPSFMVNPTSRTVNAGATADFTASYDPDGMGPKPAVNVTASSTWNSSSPAVASHQGNGRFRGQSAGRAIITAFYNSKSATFRIDDLQNLTSQAVLTVNQAGSALTVETDAATDVKSNSATLHGSVNTNNSETDVWFEYGPSEFLGQVAGNRHLPGRGAPTEVSVPLVGLQAGTTYYYRLAAQNALGTLYGSTMIFTALPAGSWRWLTVVVTLLLALVVIVGLSFAVVKIVRHWREGGKDVAPK